MKYYLSTLLVEDHDSSREYLSHALLVAKDTEQALALHHARTTFFGGDDGVQVQYGYKFAESDGLGFTVSTHSMKDIAPATFEDLSSTLQVFGDAKAADPSTQEPAEAVKTLARRLGDQLAKRNIKVSHSQLLHAVAASLGKTDWQVVVNRPPVSRWPEGNWPKTPLRDADTLSFVDRVNAIWLTQGDVEMAAKLLHVHPDGLLGSFKTAMEADTAFCGRSFDWKPEHSLAPTLGAAYEGHDFEVRMEPRAGGSVQIDGYVGNRKVISMDNYFGPDIWQLGMSSTLPTNFSEAMKALNCCNAVARQALKLYNEHRPEETK